MTPRSLARYFVASTILVLAAPPAFATVDPDAATAVFREATAICARDGGAFWGRTLCGPILLIDPEDSSIVANQADAGGQLQPAGAGGQLQPAGAVFVGTLPADGIVANSAIAWSGTLWTEMLWPLPDDRVRRQVLLAHELFHRIQPDLHMARLDGDNRHLDTLEGRYLLQLEWRALAKALEARTAAARRTATIDALAFRAARYRRFPDAAAQESALEMNEGVAEYTGVRLGLRTPDARVAFALRDLSAFVASPSFVRSFAYATGPAYGLLLDRADSAWRRELGAGRRFDLLLATALHVPVPTDLAPARIAVYDDGTLRAFEVRRDEETQARLIALKAKFVDGTVLTLPLLDASYQFNPQTLQPLGDAGTVYPTLRLSADWGVLDVQGGALLDPRRKVAVVSANGIDVAASHGDGWRLTLKPGWTVQQEGGGFVLRQAGGR